MAADRSPATYGEALKLLELARCPNATAGCVEGVIPHRISEQEWEPEQCQWCHERDVLIDAASALSETPRKLQRWTMWLSGEGLNPTEDENGAYVLYSDLQTPPSAIEPKYIAVGTLHAHQDSALHVTLDTSVQLPDAPEMMIYVVEGKRG